MIRHGYSFITIVKVVQKSFHIYDVIQEVFNINSFYSVDYTLSDQV